jgi:hypothetical protein
MAAGRVNVGSHGLYDAATTGRFEEAARLVEEAIKGGDLLALMNMADDLRTISTLVTNPGAVDPLLDKIDRRVRVLRTAQALASKRNKTGRADGTTKRASPPRADEKKKKMKKKKTQRPSPDAAKAKPQGRPRAPRWRPDPRNLKGNATHPWPTPLFKSARNGESARESRRGGERALSGEAQGSRSRSSRDCPVRACSSSTTLPTRVKSPICCARRTGRLGTSKTPG